MVASPVMGVPSSASSRPWWVNWAGTAWARRGKQTQNRQHGTHGISPGLRVYRRWTWSQTTRLSVRQLGATMGCCRQQPMSNHPRLPEPDQGSIHTNGLLGLTFGTNRAQGSGKHIGCHQSWKEQRGDVGQRIILRNVDIPTDRKLFSPSSVVRERLFWTLKLSPTDCRLSSPDRLMSAPL